MNSAFLSVGTILDSFCKPSRGPTSTMRTLLGNEPMRQFYPLCTFDKLRIKYVVAGFSPRSPFAKQHNREARVLKFRFLKKSQWRTDANKNISDHLLVGV